MSVEEEMKIAVRNVGHDPAQLAHYAYMRCCDFVCDHQQHSEELLTAMIRAIQAPHDEPRVAKLKPADPVVES